MVLLITTDQKRDTTSKPNIKRVTCVSSASNTSITNGYIPSIPPQLQCKDLLNLIENTLHKSVVKTDYIIIILLFGMLNLLLLILFVLGVNAKLNTIASTINLHYRHQISHHRGCYGRSSPVDAYSFESVDDDKFINSKHIDNNNKGYTTLGEEEEECDTREYKTNIVYKPPIIINGQNINTFGFLGKKKDNTEEDNKTPPVES